MDNTETLATSDKRHRTKIYERRDIFNFFSRTTGCEVARLARNVPVSQKSNMAVPASD
jgi:hypothetical protein